MHVIPALRKLRQEDCHEFNANLGYIVRYKLDRALLQEPISKI